MNEGGETGPRLSYLFAHDYTFEFEGYQSGRVPAHRLFGAAHLAEFGATETHYRWPSWWPKRLQSRRVWRIVQAVLVVLDQRGLAAVICTTETAALPVLLFRNLRVLRKPVLVLSVAALRPSYCAGPQRHVISWLFQGATAIYAYASDQVPKLVDKYELNPDRVRFIPFGVDIEFFPVNNSQVGDGPDVLTVGTNDGKDMPTLMAAIPPGRSCVVVTDANNVRAAHAHGVPRGVAFRQDVAIEELRTLYGTATHVVIPLRQSDTSSGQTVLLENLVAGRAVIVSGVAGIADYTKGTATVIVPSGDPECLHELLAGPPSLATPQQVAHARAAYNSRRFTRSILESISGDALLLSIPKDAG